jgi:hypothetical protein
MYNRKPDTLPEEIVLTVRTISEISVKSITTLNNGLLLLKLPDEIQMAIVSTLSGLNLAYFVSRFHLSPCPAFGRIKAFTFHLSPSTFHISPIADINCFLLIKWIFWDRF